MPALFSLAADLFASDIPSAVSQVRDRAVQFVTAFTDRRIVGLAVDALGKANVTMAQGTVGVGTLSPSDLDLLYLAIRFAVVEKYGARSKTPVVIDDVMSGLDAPRLSLMARLLKGLGKVTQVLHVTDQGEFADVADGRASL
jgi:uncharacterized protein YhaN